MSKLRGKRKLVSTTVRGDNNNLDIVCAFSDHYDDLFNCVNYNIKDMDNLYENYVKISLYCSDHKHDSTLSDIGNTMRKMKRGNGDGYDCSISNYLIMVQKHYFIKWLLYFPVC